jgi:hypothetical protein
VLLTDTLPEGTYYVPVPANQGWVHHNGVVTRAISSLPAEDSVTVQLTVGTRSHLRGEVTNTVQAKWGCTVVTATETTTILEPVLPTSTPTPTPTPTPTATPTSTPTATPSPTPTPSTGSIVPCVWNDLDGDGFPDAGEPPLPGVLIELWDSQGQLVDSCTTDDSGCCSFLNLPPGNYTVTASAVQGFFFTTLPSAQVEVVAGQVSEVFFGSRQWYMVFLPVIMKTAP